MIIDPDFFDHWRTLMLQDALGGDPAAPVYVMRVWAHCQNRRETTFSPMPAAGLKALCRYPGDADQLEAAMIAAGFIARDGAGITVPKWADHNAKLIAAWTNGSKGGRTPRGSSGAAESKPTRNPTRTQVKPKSNRPRTHSEAIRVESREEENPSPPIPPEGGSAAGPIALKTTPGFDRFWQAWPASPRKVGRAKCQATWARSKLESAADAIVAHVEAMRRTRQWQDGFEPAPQTYLNQRRWLDGVPADRSSAAVRASPLEARYPGWRHDDDRAIALGRAVGAGEPRPGESWHEYRSRISAHIERVASGVAAA